MFEKRLFRPFTSLKLVQPPVQLLFVCLSQLQGLRIDALPKLFKERDLLFVAQCFQLYIPHTPRDTGTHGQCTGSFCQSQSLNVFMENMNASKLILRLAQHIASMHFHAWKKGLKTGMYYLGHKEGD